MFGGQGLNFRTHEESLQVDSKQLTVQSCVACCVSPIGLALLIIGICAAAGTMTGVVAGGCAIGLSVPLLLATLASGRKDAVGNSRTFEMIFGLITTLAYIIIGALAIAGVLPAASVGYAVLGVAAIGLIIGCVRMYCCGGFKQAMQIASAMRNNAQ